jgi:hypothetical protein
MSKAVSHGLRRGPPQHRSSPFSAPPPLVKLLVMGDQGVGKTSIIQSYALGGLIFCCHFPWSLSNPGFLVKEKKWSLILKKVKRAIQLQGRPLPVWIKVPVTAVTIFSSMRLVQSKERK